MAQNLLPPWKALREATGLSQREIARRAGLSSGRLSSIEAGLIPRDEEAAVLRRVLTAALSAMEGGKA